VAKRDDNDISFARSFRRLGFFLLLMFLSGLVLLWRIDNPRAERVRTAVVDRLVPNMEWALQPVTKVARMVADFQSYNQIYQQNQDLRQELQQMKAWREAALQLEQKNAKLLDLNKVRLNPKLSYLTGVVLTDAGSPFRQSALINIGSRDGVKDGWPAMDGLGLVGRISGVGKNSSRVIFVTDTNSHIPVLIKPFDQRAILTGDNSLLPPLEFLENSDRVQPGDRVVTSGDGGVFPNGLLIGQVTQGADGRLRVRLAADYRRLEFLRIIRFEPTAPINDPDRLIGPQFQPQSGLSEMTPTAATRNGTEAAQ
jgi:rod shape-determining protein MreC